MRLLALGVLCIIVAAGQPVGAASAGIWIVSGAGAADLADDLKEQGIPVHIYEHLDMLAIVATDPVVHGLRQAGFSVHPNEVYALHLDRSVPKIHADHVKDVLGLQRSGPTVLVIDTGLDSNHPDFEEGINLAANVGAERSPNGLVSGVTSGAVVDRSGHGSHVAGIVAGSGEAYGPNDPQHEKYVGVYSNGRVASFQAASEASDPEDIGVDLQAALEGFDWALANQDRYQIRAITNSWGSAGDIVPDHPAGQATLKAYAAGITVFFSAGNDGTEGSLNRHCLPPWVLCIAAGTLDKTRSSFSSMGQPAGQGLGPYDHPDLTAPGSGIRSLEPTTDSSKVSRLTSGDTEVLYRDRSGTSMAAPHAAGVAALLMAANPDLSPDQVMDILVDTADPMSEEVYRVGSGYINAQKAYNLAVQTLGERQAFLAGTAVKYGGLATGDDDFSDDPISVGYDSRSGGELDATLITGPAPKAWLLTSPVPAVLLGIGVLLVLAGLRWRPAREAPTGESTAEGTH